MNRVIAYIVLVILLILGLYVYVHSLKEQIVNLKSSLKDSYVELANSKLEATRYKSALDRQSAEIDKVKIARDKAVRAYEELKSKPAKIRYNVIYKIRKVHSNECKQIKSTINYIRKLDYSTL